MKQKLEQGIYLSSWDHNYHYVAYECTNNIYYHKELAVSTPVGGYYSMRTFVPDSIFYNSLIPLCLGWLPNNAIPSDLYPELFI